MMRLPLLLALALLTALQGLALRRAPAVWQPDAITVRLAPGESILLGRAELAAPQAAREHLQLRRDPAGAWYAANASASLGLLIQDERSDSSALLDGQHINIGKAAFKVARDGRNTVLANADGSWRYDGARLLKDGRALPPCPDARLPARLAHWWNQWTPSLLQLARPMSFGGNLHCGTRLGIADLAPASAGLANKDGQARLSASLPDGVRTPIHIDQLELGTRAMALDHVDHLVLGHTRFAVHIEDGQLALRPSRHVALYTEPQTVLPAQVSWHWTSAQVWHLPHSQVWWPLALLAAGMVLATAWAWARGQRPNPAALLVALAGLAALLLQRSGSPPGAAISISLGASALLLHALRRQSLATSAALILLAIGLFAQLEQGLGAPDSAWLRHFQKSAALLAIGLGLAAWLRTRFAKAGAPPSQVRTEWALALCAAVAIAALLLQVLFGDETGVFDLQPVEFAKLALCALSAHCMALAVGRSAQQRIAVRAGAPVLLFIALLGLALIQVDDYSPLILLLVWSSAMAMAYALATRKWTLATAILAGVLGVVAAIAWLRFGGANVLAQLDFYGDRFQVWAAPTQHPHTGQQILLGARAIADGGWLGADQRLGLASLGQSAGAALRIPAVQDDFAASFFLHQHGLLGALLLWCVQAMFLAGLVQAALHQHSVSLQTRDFRQAWFVRACCFALCGGGAFVFGHFLLSWGTNLAIFPIMGQPMSFLSAGGSHLLFFLCPLLGLAAIGAPTFEENPSCRPMSNTKSSAK